jgi:hypothetical protein
MGLVEKARSPPSPQGQVAICKSDGNSFRAEGYTHIHLAEAENGYKGVCITNFTACKQWGLKVACSHGDGCRWAHHALGTIRPA